MGQVLGIVTRAIASHLIKASGYHHETAHTGAVTLIQRFGSARLFHQRVPVENEFTRDFQSRKDTGHRITVQVGTLDFHWRIG